MRIVNIVATVSLNKSVNLKKIKEKAVKFDRFPGIVIKTVNPDATALIFNSDKMVVTGVSSIKSLYKSVNEIINILLLNGALPSNVEVIASINIENIVCQDDIGFSVNLEEVALTLERTIYEPEEFPGVVYRDEDGDSDIDIRKWKGNSGWG